jgi:hypothetical protein
LALQQRRRLRDPWFIVAMLLEENDNHVVDSVPVHVVSALLWHENDNK